ncbi:MAG: hypothetical protein KG075_19555 [Alphaproteobacteria bacterium]|nr:hypothetical protein [Alphaproteobacteria bacterium]
MAFSRSGTSSITRMPRSADSTTSSSLAESVRFGAQECLISAKELEKKFPSTTGNYILTFHALELGLKAFLLKQGLSADDLRKRHGHNLVRLLEISQNHGLSLSTPDAKDLIAWINEWHDDKVKIRYDFTSTRELPWCDMILPIVDEVIAASK